jgi:hypothetical protein
MMADDDDHPLEAFVEHLGPEDGPRAHAIHQAFRDAVNPPPSLEDRVAALAKRKHGQAPRRPR